MIAIGYRQLSLYGKRTGIKTSVVFFNQPSNLLTLTSRHMSNTKTTTIDNYNNSHTVIDDARGINNDVHYMRLALRHAQVIYYI